MPSLPKLGAPAQRALQNAGITKLEHLTDLTETEILHLHGVGQNALGVLRQALSEHSLAFREIKENQSLMDKTVRAHLDNIRSDDGGPQNEAYYFLIAKTETPVDWAYEAWDELLEGLTHKDNHVRAISSQLLSNLAKSDPKGRLLKDFGALLAVTKDEKFVTARHCLQSLWKVGAAGKNQQKILLDGFTRRFAECVTEKNGTLIRYDIIQGLWNLYRATTDEKVKETALALLETEADLKYRKKYAGVWKK